MTRACHLANSSATCSASAICRISSAIADSLLRMIQRDGFSAGKTSLIRRGQLCAHVSAAKHGEKWIVIAPDKYTAAIEIMAMLGWDLAE